MKIFSLSDSKLSRINTESYEKVSPLCLSGGELFRFVNDGKNPYVIFYNNVSKTLYKFDVNQQKIVKSFYHKYFLDVTAIDVDIATGNIYLLQPYGLIFSPNDTMESSSSLLSDDVVGELPNMVLGGGIFRLDSCLTSVQNVVPRSSTNILRMKYPKDLLIDSVGRRLVVADTGNNRVLVINLNNYLLVRELRFEKLLLPSSLGMGPEDDLFVLHYDKESLSQKLSWFKNLTRLCVFDSQGTLGLSNHFYGDESRSGNLLVLDDDKAYEAYPTGTKQQWGNTDIATPNSIVTSWASGSCVIKYETGTVDKYYKDKTYFGKTNYASKAFAVNPKLAVNHLNDEFLSVVYKKSKSRFAIRNLSICEANVTTDEELAPLFQSPLSCSSSLISGYIYVLADNGQTLLKIDSDSGTLVRQKTLLPHSFDFVSVTPREEKIWLVSSKDKQIGYIDRNLNSVHIVGSFPSAIAAVSYDFWDENLLWIVSGKKLYRYSADTLTYTQLAVGSQTLRGISLGLYGYHWAFDKSKIYRVNGSGTSVLGAQSGFRDIKDIACQNWIKDLFDMGYLPSHGQIKYDPVRSNLAWAHDNTLHISNVKQRKGLEVSDFPLAGVFSSSSQSVTGSESSTTEPSSSSGCVCTSWIFDYDGPHEDFVDIDSMSVDGITPYNSNHCNLYVTYTSSGQIGTSQTTTLIYARVQVYSDSQYAQLVADSGLIQQQDTASAFLRDFTLYPANNSGLSGTISFDVSSFGYWTPTYPYNGTGYYTQATTYFTATCSPYGLFSTSSSESSKTAISLSSQTSSGLSTQSSVSSISSSSISSSSTSSQSSLSSQTSSETSTSVSSTSSLSTSSESSSSSSTERFTTSSSSTVRLSTTSSVSSVSSGSSSSSSTAIEFYMLPVTASFSNYDAIGQSYSPLYSSTTGETYAAKRGSYAANTEQRYGYLPDNPAVRVEYWDSSYSFRLEHHAHTSGSIFVNFGDSGNLHLRDDAFVNILWPEDLRSIAYDYPYWGIKKLTLTCHKSDGSSVGQFWLPIDEGEVAYRHRVEQANGYSVFEGPGRMHNGEKWIGRNRNLSLVYRFNELPLHSHISIEASIHFRGMWLGTGTQTEWVYNEGTSGQYLVVKNPYQAGYVAPPPPAYAKEVTRQLLSGPHCFWIGIG